MTDYGVLIFAGTAEGRALCEGLNARGVAAAACVATDYGRDMLSGLENIRVAFGRMNMEEMARFIEEGRFRLVVDATHPYASEATDNIRQACERTSAELIRLLREAGERGNARVVEDMPAAVAALRNTAGNVLATTGSKELPLFKELENYKERLFARVLPCAESLAQCRELGLDGRHVIAMQGPFSREMNAAMLKQFGCRWLVTKNTGAAGGLAEKLDAAEEAGASVILIDRPGRETGLGLAGTLEMIYKRLGLPADATAGETDGKKEFFPLFVPSRGKKALVVGGGNIAARRVNTLAAFQFDITVVAPVVTDDIKKHVESGGIRLLERTFSDKDLEGCHMVVAATDDRAVNARVGARARNEGRFVSVADVKEECNFYFPAVIAAGGVVAGVTSEGRDHGLAARAAKKIREALT